MKTILEISSKQNTSYAMPDWVYPVIKQMLYDPMNRKSSSPCGRSRAPSVHDVVQMLPEEIRPLVEIKVIETPRQMTEEGGLVVYYDELTEAK